MDSTVWIPDLRSASLRLSGMTAEILALPYRVLTICSSSSP
jgi:hypothetical protein